MDAESFRLLLNPTATSASVEKTAELPWRDRLFSASKGPATDPDRFAAREVWMRPKDPILANVIVLALIGSRPVRLRASGRRGDDRPQRVVHDHDYSIVLLAIFCRKLPASWPTAHCI
jgi:hypothetical protein